MNKCKWLIIAAIEVGILVGLWLVLVIKALNA